MHLVNFADFAVLVEVYRRVEVGDHGVGQLDDHLALALVHERAHLLNPLRGAVILEASTTQW